MSALNTIFESGYKGGAMTLLLVCAYKLYTMKITTDGSSDCCRCLRLHVHTENAGGPAELMTPV